MNLFHQNRSVVSAYVLGRKPRSTEPISQECAKRHASRARRHNEQKTDVSADNRHGGFRSGRIEQRKELYASSLRHCDSRNAHHDGQCSIRFTQSLWGVPVMRHRHPPMEWDEPAAASISLANRPATDCPHARTQARFGGLLTTCLRRLTRPQEAEVFQRLPNAIGGDQPYRQQVRSCTDHDFDHQSNPRRDRFGNHHQLD